MRDKTVVVIKGLPLSGKNTLAEELVRFYWIHSVGIHYIDIDAGPVACAPPREEDPYRSDESRDRDRRRMRAAYSIMHAAVAANLENGFSLIVSATYSRKIYEDELLDAVKRGGGSMAVLWCQFNDTEEEVTRRVNDRLARGAVGGCRSVSHYFDDKKRYAGTILPHLVVDTSIPYTPARIASIIQYINE